jgi:stearoyl-CoA desaturase (delta-9 desaturase)
MKPFLTTTLKVEQPPPPMPWKNWYKEVKYFQFTVLVVIPIIGLVASRFHPLQRKTMLFTLFYYYLTGTGEPFLQERAAEVSLLTFALGITAGYHRLWSHRAYNASRPLQYLLALAGAGAFMGPIRQWARSHRAHHRYTDTELDPYNARKGFLWSHMGWLVVKHRRKPGCADISDLTKNDIVMWQDRHYLACLLFAGVGLPALIPWLFWGDALGGWIYAVVLRMFLVHQVFYLLV